jgi:hypothetical protein
MEVLRYLRGLRVLLFHLRLRTRRVLPPEPVADRGL